MPTKENCCRFYVGLLKVLKTGTFVSACGVHAVSARSHAKTGRRGDALSRRRKVGWNGLAAITCLSQTCHRSCQFVMQFSQRCHQVFPCTTSPTNVSALFLRPMQPFLATY